jgi:CRISPR/Cas system-associated protein Csx1
LSVEYLEEEIIIETEDYILSALKDKGESNEDTLGRIIADLASIYGIMYHTTPDMMKKRCRKIYNFISKL